MTSSGADQPRSTAATFVRSGVHSCGHACGHACMQAGGHACCDLKVGRCALQLYVPRAESTSAKHAWVFYRRVHNSNSKQRQAAASSSTARSP